MAQFDPSIPASLLTTSGGAASPTLSSAYQPQNKAPSIPPRQQLLPTSTNMTGPTSQLFHSANPQSLYAPHFYGNPFSTWSTPWGGPSFGAGGTFDGLSLMTGAGTAPLSLSASLDQHLRPTLETVNNMVQAVNSLTVMVQSCFMAVYTSCRAVVSMADQMSGIYEQVLRTLSSLQPLLRVRRLLRSLLTLLSLRGVLPFLRTSGSLGSSATMLDSERVWGDVQLHISQGAPHPVAPEDSLRNWVSMLFFVITLGLPLLIWRVVKTLNRAKKPLAAADPLWQEPLQAVVLYNFTARNCDELSVEAGAQLAVAKENPGHPLDSGWCMARNGAGKIGLVPKSFLLSEGF